MMLTVRPSVVPTQVPNAKVITYEGGRDVLCVIRGRSRMISSLSFAASETRGRPRVGVLQLTCMEPIWTLGNHFVFLSTRKLNTSNLQRDS